MDKINELKKNELKILDEIDRICKKHNIKYYLAYGSAIGAIRHKGFIPWDDDIDIHMLSSDLIKFKEVCQKELSNKFYYQDKLTDKYYYNHWSKVGLENTTWMPKQRIVDCKYGVCIDIFPVFPLKDTNKDKKRMEKYTKILLITSAKYYVLNTKKEIYSKMKKLIHKSIPNWLNNYLYKLAFNKLNKDSDNFDKVVICDISNDRNVYFNKSVIIGDKTLKFEKRDLPVVNDIDTYLKTLYGDYMTPPPEDARYGHDKGNDIIYDFKNSYRKYIGDTND